MKNYERKCLIMEIKTKLEDVISLKLEKAKVPDSEESERAVCDAVKLTDCLIEIKKFESDEEAKKEEQKRQIQKERWQNGIAIAGIVVPASLSLYGICKTFKFDDAGGIISSTLGRGFLNKVIPKK